MSALSEYDVPVLLSIVPLRSFEEADYLSHEVPDISIPQQTLTAMERAGQRAEQTGLELAVRRNCPARHRRPNGFNTLHLRPARGFLGQNRLIAGLLGRSRNQCIVHRDARGCFGLTRQLLLLAGPGCLGLKEGHGRGDLYLLRGSCGRLRRRSFLFDLVFVQGQDG